jgi:hypothetical protein
MEMKKPQETQHEHRMERKLSSLACVHYVLVVKLRHYHIKDISNSVNLKRLVGNRNRGETQKCKNKKHSRRVSPRLWGMMILVMSNINGSIVSNTT